MYYHWNDIKKRKEEWFRSKDIQSALRYFNTVSSQLAAINISLGNEDDPLLCEEKTGWAEVENLRKKGVAVIAASGNSGTIKKAADVEWPACLNNVISVGGTIGGQLFQDSSTKPSVDFLAIAEATGIRGSQDYHLGTSYAVPRVAAAFAVIKTQFPSATIGEISKALREGSKKIWDNRIGVKKYFHAITPESIKVAIQYLQTGTHTPVKPVEVVPGENYPITLGNGLDGKKDVTGATVAVNLKSEDLSLRKSQTEINGKIFNNKSRYCYLSFEGWEIDDSELSLCINGTCRQTLRGGSKNYRLWLKPEFFKIGKNVIEFRVINPPQSWGIKNLTFHSLGPQIILEPLKKDTEKYGYRYGTNKHYAKLHLKFFAKKGSVDRFSIRGWDIDVADEILVSLNDTRLGFLSVSGSSEYNAGDTFVFDSSKLGDDGWNYITLTQRWPYTGLGGTTRFWGGPMDEKWGVTDLLIYKPTIPIVPLMQLQLLKKKK